MKSTQTGTLATSDCTETRRGEVKIYNNAFCQGESFLEMLFYIVHYLEKKQNESERRKKSMYRSGLRALLFFEIHEVQSCVFLIFCGDLNDEHLRSD